MADDMTFRLGEALAAHCTAALDRAEARLDALGEDAADED